MPRGHNGGVADSVVVVRRRWKWDEIQWKRRRKIDPKDFFQPCQQQQIPQKMRFLTASGRNSRVRAVGGRGSFMRNRAVIFVLRAPVDLFDVRTPGTPNSSWCHPSRWTFAHWWTHLYASGLNALD